MAKKRLAIWFDPEAAAELDAIAENLAKQIGFKPSPSQTLRYVMSRYRVACGERSALRASVDKAPHD